MVFHLTFRVRKNLNPIELELARREICWLIKDRLIPNTPAGIAQKGFSFVRAQVRPFKFMNGEFVPDFSGDKARYEDTFRILSQFFERREEAGFIVPLRVAIDASPLIERLAFSDCILEGPGGELSVEDATSHPCTKEFWTRPFTQRLIPQAKLAQADMAVFNIIHPYQEGCIANVTDGCLTNLTSQATFETDDFGKYRSEIASTLVSVLLEENEPVNLYSNRMKPLIRRIASWSLQGANMKSAIQNTGALSGAYVMFIFDIEGKVRNPTKLGGAIDYIKETIRIGDLHGLSLSLLLNDGEQNKVYLGLRKHPRDDKLDFLGPEFNPEHEIKRLEQVEDVRNSHPGYKRGPYGDGEVIKELSSGWLVRVTRPGFKDCEDFHVTIESPEGEEMDPYAGKNPNFATIFEESRLHLECPHSGAMWLRSVLSLWLAREEPDDIIERFLDKCPECRCRGAFRYDDAAFLWLIYYLFVEEDMNYRFWYHPPLRGLRYRKQGRDMPMNGILRVAMNPSDECLPQETDRQTRQNDKLVRRPRSGDFHGPKHIEKIVHEVLAA